jgi:hypothetical protein
MASDSSGQFDLCVGSLDLHASNVIWCDEIQAEVKLVSNMSWDLFQLTPSFCVVRNCSKA